MSGPAPHVQQQRFQQCWPEADGRRPDPMPNALAGGGLQGGAQLIHPLEPNNSPFEEVLVVSDIRGVS